MARFGKQNLSAETIFSTVYIPSVPGSTLSFRQIPAIWLEAGSTRDIALDEYISGSGTITLQLTGEPDWITLTDGTGVNRTLQIRPPTPFEHTTQFEIFSRYIPMLSATSGSQTQTIQVYVYVAKEALSLRWILKTSNPQMNRRVELDLIFSHDVMNLTAADLFIVGATFDIGKELIETDAKNYKLTLIIPDDQDVGSISVGLRPDFMSS